MENEKINIPTDVEELNKMKEDLENCNYQFQSEEPEGVEMPQYKLVFGGKEYYVVYLEGEDGNDLIMPIHEMVAKAFIPNPNNYKYVRHKDGNTLNNNADNLEWVKELN